ncbi:SMYD3 [Acrasis kona]|uniref:SMYD3 n=1 Tax=Acrasis kona TaxID=1008807 RepID=A0AAW2Z4P4_9EUKA
MDSQRSVQCRQLKDFGNKLLTRKMYKEAVDVYTKALKLDQENHVVWSNRAFANCMINREVHAASDAQSSFTIICKGKQHPSNQTLLKIKQYHISKDFIEQNWVWLRKIERPNEDNEILNSIIDLYNELIQSTDSSDKPKVPLERDTKRENVSEKKSKNDISFIPSQSSRVSMKKTPKGVTLQANKNMKEGDRLFVEAPFILATKSTRVCQFCNFENTSVSCAQCPYEKYCSVRCRDMASKTYHKILCGKDLSALREYANSGVTKSSAMVLFALRARAITMSHPNYPCETIGIREFATLKYETMKNMPSPLILLDIMNFINQVLDPNPFFDLQWLLRMCSCFISNTIELPSPGTGCSVALMLNGCRFNHSCDGNVQMSLSKGGLEYSVNRKVKKGDQLTCCYVNPNLNYKQRQFILSQSKIKCECRRCVEEDRGLITPSAIQGSFSVISMS